MAIKPYQRTGLMTQGFQPSQGYALKEAQNTQLVMADQLDRMSSFFFKQAAAGFEEKGKEYGASVVPDLEQISIATASVEDDKELNMPSFSNTIFGRAAKKEALAVLENRLTIQAAEAFNQSVFAATQNGHTPATLRTGLDGTITGISDTLLSISPSLSAKVKAKLSMNAAGHFQNYRMQYLTASQTSIDETNVEAVQVMLQELGPMIDAQLLSGDVLQFTSEAVALQREAIRKDYAQKVQLAYKSVSQQNSAMEKFDTEFANHIRSHVYTELVKADKLTVKNAKKILTLKEPIGHEIDVVVAMMSDEERMTLSNQIINGINNEQNAQNNQDSQAEKAKAETIKTLTQDFNNIIATDTPNQADANAKIEELREIDPVKANELLGVLSSTEGQRLYSIGSTVSNLKDKLDDNVLEYDELEARRSELSAAKYRQFRTEINDYEASGIKDALVKVAIDLKFDPDIEVSQDMDPFKNERAIYNQIQVLAKQELEQARIEDKAFDAKAVVARIALENKDEIKDQLQTQYKEEADKAMLRVIGEINPQFNKEFSPTDYFSVYEFIINSEKSEDEKRKDFYKNNKFGKPGDLLLMNAVQRIQDYLKGIGEL